MLCIILTLFLIEITQGGVIGEIFQASFIRYMIQHLFMKVLVALMILYLNFISHMNAQSFDFAIAGSGTGAAMGAITGPDALMGGLLGATTGFFRGFGGVLPKSS
ncbi:hypothetical protein [Bartonella sp. ML70XJBT.G]|uniref:hypothetical protein n=1 Tax=Bartonella sp. ML70XJBT.G TaxID=3019093 RepID=UPI00235FF6E3|nr:hypothetical protein [Bartonella sp. ML70XJBT.G]